MLIVGLGGGTAAAFVPPSIEQVDVFELEPAVVEANVRVRELRERDPLADPRINIILNDGRNGLALTTKNYDLIVSQPSHPWTAGASHLYTVEFNQIVDRRLRPGGVFLQWMDAHYVDDSLLKAMAAGLRETFGFVRLYQPSRGGLMFLASDEPIAPEKMVPTNFLSAPAMKSYYGTFGINTPTDLLALLRLDEESVCRICVEHGTDHRRTKSAGNEISFPVGFSRKG